MTEAAIRLFVADDHALFRDGIRALLSATADIVCVGEAATGEAAVTATRRILRDHPAAGVIIVTMLEDDASLVAAMRMGARGYVLKGANHQELLQAIRTVAQGQAFFGPAIATRIARFFVRQQNSQAGQPLPELTEREREILVLMVRHYTNPEIAQQLGIGEKTIRNHVSNIFNKLQVATRAQAIDKARQAGLGGA